MGNSIENELREVVAAWDRAMVGNDPATIGAFMREDWIIVGSDGRTQTRAGFLGLIASGDLSHNVMTTRGLEIRLYGDAAVTLAEGTSGGQFRGQRFLEEERVSCVFVREAGRWRCVHTHLSPRPGSKPG